MSFVVAEVDNVKDDVMQNGRARIKVLGHQDSLSEEQLRWARPIGTADNPKINKSGSGPIGQSGNGLQKGSKVLVWYMDGPDGQVPIIVGSLPSDDDPQGDKTKGSAPYQAKGKETGYKDQRLIAAKGDRTDPANARNDTKPIHDYAHDEAPNDTKEQQFSRLPEDVKEQSFSLAAMGNPGT